MVVLALIAEPFLCPSSPIHQNFGRFDPQWFQWYQEKGVGGGGVNAGGNDWPFVTEVWFLCLRGLNRAVVPAMSGRCHWVHLAHAKDEEHEAWAMIEMLDILLKDGVGGLIDTN
jgi:hypothetical protein